MSHYLQNITDSLLITLFNDNRYTIILIRRSHYRLLELTNMCDRYGNLQNCSINVWCYHLDLNSTLEGKFTFQVNNSSVFHIFTGVVFPIYQQIFCITDILSNDSVKLSNDGICKFKTRRDKKEMGIYNIGEKSLPFIMDLDETLNSEFAGWHLSKKEQCSYRGIRTTSLIEDSKLKSERLVFIQEIDNNESRYLSTPLEREIRRKELAKIRLEGIQELVYEDRDSWFVKPHLGERTRHIRDELLEAMRLRREREAKEKEESDNDEIPELELKEEEPNISEVEFSPKYKEIIHVVLKNAIILHTVESLDGITTKIIDMIRKETETTTQEPVIAVPYQPIVPIISQAELDKHHTQTTRKIE